MNNTACGILFVGLLLVFLGLLGLRRGRMIAVGSYSIAASEAVNDPDAKYDDENGWMKSVYTGSDARQMAYLYVASGGILILLALLFRDTIMLNLACVFTGFVLWIADRAVRSRL